MKKTRLLIPLIFATCLHAEKHVATYISPHSPSVNAARELAGWEHKVNIPTDSDIYTSISLTPEVIQTFRRERVAQCLFGDDILECKNRFKIAGSRTEGRREEDWLADYFGLPTDFVSNVCVKPNASYALLDINFFLGLNKLLDGLYFRIHAPIVHTRWDLDIEECIQEVGENDHDPGYFNAEGIPRNQLLKNFITFISGQAAPQAEGLLFRPLTVAKMSPCSLRELSLAEIQAAVGWNFMLTDWYHVGANLRIAIPAGNRPKGIYLFEPIIGNGHHWEAGAGFSGHVKVWEREETGEKVELYLDLNLTHMFETKQCRFFDLKEKPNSRYMLAAKLGTAVTNNLHGGSFEPIAQFQQEVSPIANLTLFEVKVKNTLQADLAFMMVYTHDYWSWLFGYGFWNRSCDDLNICCDDRFEKNLWGIKGDAQLFGFEETTDDPIQLSATQSTATINRGKNFPLRGTKTTEEIDKGKQNPRIDGPQVATANGNTVVTKPGGSDQINTSIQPVLLTINSIDFIHARTKGMGHKIFGHFSRTWYEKKDYTPYVGFGAEVEFSQNKGICPPNIKIDCINCSFTFWGVWLKGGVSFG